MSDKITYPSPIGGQVLPGSDKLEPLGFAGDYIEEWFEIKFYGDNGVRFTVRIEGQQAKDIIETMNTKDFSTLHMKKWLGQLALATGKLPGGGTAT